MFELIRLLRVGHIDGFILDRYTFVTLCTYMDHQLATNHQLAHEIRYMKTKTVQTEKAYSGQRLSFGLLVRDDHDYEFFIDFVRGSDILINVCCGLVINDIHVSRGVHIEYLKDEQLFTIDSGLFWPTFVAAGVALVCIACFGFAYEAWWNKTTDGKKSISVATNNTVVFFKRAETL